MCFLENWEKLRLGGLRHGSHCRVGHIPHGPDVEGKVVTDDGSLHPDIEDHGLRGVLDCVEEEFIF